MLMGVRQESRQARTVRRALTPVDPEGIEEEAVEDQVHLVAEAAAAAAVGAACPAP